MSCDCIIHTARVSSEATFKKIVLLEHPVQTAGQCHGPSSCNVITLFSSCRCMLQVALFILLISQDLPHLPSFSCDCSRKEQAAMSSFGGRMLVCISHCRLYNQLLVARAHQQLQQFPASPADADPGQFRRNAMCQPNRAKRRQPQEGLMRILQALLSHDKTWTDDVQDNIPEQSTSRQGKTSLVNGVKQERFAAATKDSCMTSAVADSNIKEVIWLRKTQRKRARRADQFEAAQRSRRADI